MLKAWADANARPQESASATGGAEESTLVSLLLKLKKAPTPEPPLLEHAPAEDAAVPARSPAAPAALASTAPALAAEAPPGPDPRAAAAAPTAGSMPEVPHPHVATPVDPTASSPAPPAAPSGPPILHEGLPRAEGPRRRPPVAAVAAEGVVRVGSAVRVDAARAPPDARRLRAPQRAGRLDLRLGRGDGRGDRGGLRTGGGFPVIPPCRGAGRRNAPRSRAPPTATCGPPIT